MFESGRSADQVFATIFLLVDGNRPAWELIGRLAIGGIDQKAKGLNEVRFLFRIEGDEAKAAGLLVSLVVAVGGLADLRISDGVKLGFVATSVEIFARVFLSRLGPIGMRHFHLVWPPPPRIPCGDGWCAEGPVAVTLLVHAVLSKGGQMLITIDVQRH